ncbi:MAG: preprotein translocase subunit SecA, partial [Bacteroidales bacterium]|nr:preprotein translocase subunit SecA [Bacteroidales bacterium]
GRGTDIKLTPEVRKAGGLAIIGTERHESRRVDRQLRGRSGRQGDPGSSQFYVSLEDNLMRLFGSDRISGIMDRLGLKEGEVIQHAMISKSIERAQRKVEENNFGIRKRLLEYDDVMNSQREVIYTKRKHALLGERLSLDINNMTFDMCESIVLDCHGNVDYSDFSLEVLRYLSVEPPVDEAEYKEVNAVEITEKLYQTVRDTYQRKQQSMYQQAWPVIKDVFEKQGKVYENIVVPVSDGTRIFQILTNLEKAYENEGYEVLRNFEKTVNLATIDETWKEHLRELDDLKQSVQNATYEQKDPLLIYKFESFELFKIAIDRINKDVVSSLLKGNIPLSSQVQQARGPQRLDTSGMQQTKGEARSAYEGGGGEDQSPPRQAQRIQPVRSGRKIGRNEIIKVRYQNGELVEAKYKKLETDINSGACVLTS